MNLEISRAFVRDVEPLPGQSKKVVLDVIQEIQTAKNLHEIRDCIKLSGSENLYRIRRGNYRITFSLDGSSIILKRMLPRGRIYKKHILK